MTKEYNRYDRLIDTLRKSKPAFNNEEGLSERVIRQIREEKPSFRIQDSVEEFFFGWVYIGWVRRSMVAAAMLIIVFFGYQQTLILQKVNGLPQQKTLNDTPVMTNSGGEIPNSMMLYRLTGRKLSEKEIKVTQKEIDQLIRSVNKLQVKYQDLFYLIEQDPQLKKYVESKMNENSKN